MPGVCFAWSREVDVLRDSLLSVDLVYAPGARYVIDFLLAASISSGVISGIVDSRTAPEAFTARLRASALAVSGRSEIGRAHV